MRIVIFVVQTTTISRGYCGGDGNIGPDFGVSRNCMGFVVVSMSIVKGIRVHTGYDAMLGIENLNKERIIIVRQRRTERIEIIGRTLTLTSDLSSRIPFLIIFSIVRSHIGPVHPCRIALLC